MKQMHTAYLIHICTICSMHLVGVFKGCLMYENAQNEEFQNMEVVTFMFIPCVLNIKCLFYTNICKNKQCKFILNHSNMFRC